MRADLIEGVDDTEVLDHTIGAVDVEHRSAGALTGIGGGKFDSGSLAALALKGDERRVDVDAFLVDAVLDENDHPLGIAARNRIERFLNSLELSAAIGSDSDIGCYFRPSELHE